MMGPEATDHVLATPAAEWLAVGEMKDGEISEAGGRIPLIIIGCGGHGRVVRDIAEASERFAVIAIADDAFAAAERQRDGVWHAPVAFALSLLHDHPASMVFIAVGGNDVRRQIAERLKLPLHRYAMLAHPRAIVSRYAFLAPGVVIMPGAVVNSGARIGAHAIINSGAIVEHDAIVGAYAHLSPNAAIAGAVQVGEGAHLGIGSSVIPALQIGAWSVLGAGAAAVRDIPAHVVAVGVPAKVPDCYSIQSLQSSNKGAMAHDRA